MPTSPSREGSPRSTGSGSKPASPLMRIPPDLADGAQYHVLVCRSCEYPLCGSSDIIRERTDVWSKAVFAYELDVLDAEGVWCYSATNPSENRFDVARITPVAMPLKRKRVTTISESMLVVEEADADEDDDDLPPEAAGVGNKDGGDGARGAASARREQPAIDEKGDQDNRKDTTRHTFRARVHFPAPQPADPAPSPVVGKSLVLEGPFTPEHSWFPGFAWCFAKCGKCGAHLGWGFARESDIEAARVAVAQAEEAFNSVHLKAALAAVQSAPASEPSNDPNSNPDSATDADAAGQRLRLANLRAALLSRLSLMTIFPSPEQQQQQRQQQQQQQQQQEQEQEQEREQERENQRPSAGGGAATEFPVAFIGLIVTKTRERLWTKDEIESAKRPMPRSSQQRLLLRQLLEQLLGGELDDPTVAHLVDSDDENDDDDDVDAPAVAEEEELEVEDAPRAIREGATAGAGTTVEAEEVEDGVVVAGIGGAATAVATAAAAEVSGTATGDPTSDHSPTHRSS